MIRRTVLALLLAAGIAQPSAAKERLFVLTDIGNEPDDQMSLVRLLLYSNEIDVEGLVATTSTWQKEKVSPEIAAGVIAAYGKVLPNLKLHASGWPEEADLIARLTSGVAGYGMAALDKAPLSAGANALIAAADRSDTRPLWVSLWGGGNTLAQALSHVRATRSPTALAAFVAKLRVYSISDQDDAGPWIRREFPKLFYIAKPSSPDGNEYASATWTGISGDQFYRNGQGADFTTVSNDWLEANIRSKGPLGAAYPRYMFIMEGDTPAFLGLIPNGLNAPEHPNWGGWGGRYVMRTPYGETRPLWTQGGDAFPRVSAADTVNGVTSEQATIWRWRTAFQHDFAARMDWTVQPYTKANHPPITNVKPLPFRGGVGGGGCKPGSICVREAGIPHPNPSPEGEGLSPITITARVGEPVTLDASASSDPDGNRLSYRWLHYAEAGFESGFFGPAPVAIKGDATPKATLTATATCAPNWLKMGECPATGTAHVILAVTDNGKPALTRYRRIILTVARAEGAK